MTICVSCEKELAPESGNSETEYQFDNALWVGFFGGYGMFVDDIETEYGYSKPMLAGAAHEAVLCHDCAHKLCEANPWIEKLLQPARSHAHTQEYWDKHPYHEGWDTSLEKLF